MDAAAFARKIAEALAPIDEVRVAYFFGSRARGAARKESDLDVAVKYDASLDAATRERVRRRIVLRLTEGLGAIGERADVVDIERCDSGVGFRAICDGVRVASRTKREQVMTEVSVARRHDDDAPRRALFREAATRAAARMGGSGG